MKVLVFGATGGSGHAIVSRLLDEGHDVTAFVRNPDGMETAPKLTIAEGDATDADDVAGVLPGHEAIVISLGQRPEPFEWLAGQAPIRARLRLRGRHPQHHRRDPGRCPPAACRRERVLVSAPRARPRRGTSVSTFAYSWVN